LIKVLEKYIKKKENDELMINFTSEILSVFEKYGINGHIEWSK